MATVTMTLEEYEAMTALIRSDSEPNTNDAIPGIANEPPKKKRNNAYQRRYKAAFRKLAPKYKLKSGKWKSGGFKKAVKLAHKEAKR